VNFVNKEIFIIAMGDGEWVRVWEDNFNWNGGIDCNKWEFEVGGNGWGLYLVFLLVHSVFD
jgi:hypothetical protein